MCQLAAMDHGWQCDACYDLACWQRCRSMCWAVGQSCGGRLFDDKLARSCCCTAAASDPATAAAAAAVAPLLVSNMLRTSSLWKNWNTALAGLAW